ncbi:MAG: hypothetical protein LBH16_01610 [Treponema sp.]|jgi:heptaprenyl diphosphate synthase|nr:hypothetical protein [Treponema sp.]
MGRREIYNNFFSAKALFIAGLLIMPALLFNSVTEYRVIQFLFFWFLAWLCGIKTNPVITIFIFLFIIAFNLIVPYGRVLYSFGGFKITSGALAAGIHRAATLEALVMLSKVCVRQDMKFPGAFGGFLGESLRIFSFLMSGKYGVKGKITGKNLIAEIDKMMLELSGKDFLQDNSQEAKTRPAGYFILTVVTALSWSPWIVYFL